MSRSRRPPLVRAALALSLTAVALVACGEATPVVTPSPSASAPATATAPAASPAIVSQTDTDWGRIWDALPAAFPRYPGSVVTETGEFEAVSAEFAVPEDPGIVTAWLQAGLEGAGYSTEALSGPLEDGSRVIDSVADGGCRIETVIRSLGEVTHVAVRFGAACPFE
ncbi:MAG TPA: hypothetical protein VFR14_10610 [Candidatus Limnocylindrales bacterium]|nr:hypothetical protein [Candidatus Limnocylindrales bacterium]